MKGGRLLVPSVDLSTYFRSNGLAYTAFAPLKLGFGHGNKQYKLYAYPAPAADEIMAVFYEWHTGDFSEIDTNPYIAIGMRGPYKEEPHRGRGLAIGILANQVSDPEDPENPIPLFKGCPDPPGGPSFFIEDFTKNDGNTPIPEWQLSLGKDLPQLQGNSIYRIGVQVSIDRVWVNVWQVIEKRSVNAKVIRDYVLLGQADSPDEGLEFGGNPGSPCQENKLDRGRGNAFIGSGFADPETRSWIDNIYITHWKTRE